MEQWAILVAGGSGLRMGAPLPKQFLPLAGKPILVHTIELFLNFLKDINRIRVVIPAEHFSTWEQIAPEHLKKVPVVKGGNNRFESVKNGLSTIPNIGFVAIHDGVRPLATEHLIQTSFSLAITKGSAIPLVPLVDSVRHSNEGNWLPFDRELIRAVQTPQVFSTSLIKTAYANTTFSSTITDDTMVFEKSGFIPHFLEGERETIKITTPLDLLIGEAILLERQRS